MTDIEKIRDLDIQNVEPQHFLEMGADVISALRQELGDSTVKDLYEKSKGESANGFAERFGDALREYADEHPELFEKPDVVKQDDSYPDGLRDDIAFSLDELRDKYQEMRDTHLSRNIFVSWEKLRIDIAARANDEVGADGKYKVSGGTIAVDILGIIRGNVFETIIETVLRRMLDSIFPAERDPVTIDDTIATIADSGTDTGELLTSLEFVDEMGIHDNGFVDTVDRLNPQEIEAVKNANPLFGQHFGFDMTKSAVPSGSMRIWRGGFSRNVDAVVNGRIQSVGIPNICMIELQGNLYHVSPFGKVLNSEIRNANAELPIGSVIERIDISARSRAPLFEALAAEAGCSIEELKNRYTTETQENFISKIANGIENHATYLKEIALPEIQRIKESFQSDQFVLDSRSEAFRTEIEHIKEDPEKRDHLQELENKLDQIASLSEDIDRGIERCDKRTGNIQETLEQYEEVLEALPQTGIDVESRYLMASNLEKSSVGRAEFSEYIPKDIDESVQELVQEEKASLLSNIERYNEANPDNQLKEKDGHVYNRYGVSEIGIFDTELCDPAEKPDTDSPAEIEEFSRIYDSIGFDEFHSYQEKGEFLQAVEETERDTDAHEIIPDDTEKSEESTYSDLEKGEDGHKAERIDDKMDIESDTAIDMQKTDSVERGEQAVTSDESQLVNEQKKEKEEGGYDGDIPEIALEEDIQNDTDKHEAKSDLEPAETVDASSNEFENADDKEKEPGEHVVDKDDILEGFYDYLNYDTYSFGGDLVPQLSDMDTKDADHLLLNTLSDLYMDSHDESMSDRLYYLTMEVATYNDNGVMPAIEELIQDLQERGMNDFDIAQTLNELEPYVLGGIEDLMAISADEVEQRTIKLGDDIWTVTPHSIVNDVTGQEEDPDKLVDLIRSGTNQIFGDNIGDTAVEQTLATYDNTIDGHELDFLDMFFNSSLENTLRDVMHDLMSVEMKDIFVDDTTASDQFENSVEHIEIPDDMTEYEGLEDMDSLIIPDYFGMAEDVDSDSFIE